MQRVYVASSWRNTVQPLVVATLRNAGYIAYDFRNPDEKTGFHWSDVYGEVDHEACTPWEFIEALKDPLSDKGFASDFNAMMAADIFVMVLPCERDAHLELGWAAGAGKETHILLDSPCKASLMYKMVDFIHPTLDDLMITLGDADV